MAHSSRLPVLLSFQAVDEASPKSIHHIPTKQSSPFRATEKLCSRRPVDLYWLILYFKKITENPIFGLCEWMGVRQCGVTVYEAWRENVDLGTFQHCWKCGLSQRICRRLEDDGWCEYPEVMLPGIFILYHE